MTWMGTAAIGFSDLLDLCRMPLEQRNNRIEAVLINPLFKLENLYLRRMYRIDEINTEQQEEGLQFRHYYDEIRITVDKFGPIP